MAEKEYIKLKRRVVYRGEVYNALEAERIRALGNISKPYYDGYCDGLNKAIQILANDVVDIPAADARSVVLCKDCKHWEYDAIFRDGWCRGRHQGNPNWYCADGEKREES